VSGLEDRRAAVVAQLDALTDHERSAFLAYLSGRDVGVVELPLAEFLAGLARQREQGTAVLDSDGLRQLDDYLNEAFPEPGQ
jgi:uncharacterized protein YbjT (DUF2867 family)